ncbi:MAG: polysaccharide biosynthesis tyrosine autokinase [Prevotella sp.]|nr:polysaccharide biosynthesis tyrosine autokinase [Prevotella sp.]
MNEEEQSWFSFQNLFAVLVINWHWFLMSFIIFICAALLYLRYAEPVYNMSAMMLIKDEGKKGNSSQIISNMQDLGFMTTSVGIENEIYILQSRILARDAVKDLKLYTEYRSVGHVSKPLMYGNQPMNVDLDPLHLDSLDKELLKGVNSIRMTLTKEGSKYVVRGNEYFNGKEGKAFARSFSSLPATFKIGLGTLTFTKNLGYDLEEGQTCQVTINPPMQVAGSYVKSMEVSPASKQTSIAQLTLKDKNIERGLDFLTRLVTCYNLQANADKNEIAMKTEEFINERISKINSELGLTEGAIEDFKRRNAVTDIGIDASSSVQMTSQYSAQLSKADAEIRILDNLRDYVNSPKNKYQLIPSNVGMTDATATNLISSYNQAVQDRNRLLKAASEQAPQVLTLTATIEELQQSIQNALLQARRSADINRQGIQSQYAKFQGKVSTAPVAERVLTQIGRQQDVKSGLYLMLLQKREENTISLAATADKGKLIDEPVYEGKVSPKSAIILLAAAVLGLCLPLGIIFLLSVFRYKIEGHEDLARLTTLPVIADVAVTTDNVKDKAGIVVKANKNSLIDEIFRSMRTNIQFMLKKDEKVILFTSSTSGEGKTFNAANLAVSFALLGKKVILCGLDIRKPALGRLFGVSDRNEGITSLLAMDKVTKEALDSQIKKSVNDLQNFDMLLAGPVPPNPTELLARDNFGDVVKMLRERYDYVIFDTAPVGIVTDTIQIGQHVDVTVFVCRADYTPKSSVSMINTLSKEGKFPNPCIVLNGIDMSKRKYGYYYGYGNYGKYGRYGNYGSYYGNYGSYGQYAESHYGDKNDDSIKK